MTGRGRKRTIVPVAPSPDTSGPSQGRARRVRETAHGLDFRGFRASSTARGPWTNVLADARRASGVHPFGVTRHRAGAAAVAVASRVHRRRFWATSGGQPHDCRVIGDDARVAAESVPTVELRDGTPLLRLGFGVFLVPPAETVEVVSQALNAGYRHIDAAAAYRNEAEVGEAIRASGYSRDDVFVTTKCFNSDHGYDEATRACHASLERLDIGTIDLYLIHWPVPAHDRYVETWQAFIDLQAQGLVRSIGVSNFQPVHLGRLIAETAVTPAVNQIELHPRLQQPTLRRLHAELGIVTETWSSLARGEMLGDPVLEAIAARSHGKTTAQVAIRWSFQLGNVVLTKSVTPARIREPRRPRLRAHGGGDRRIALDAGQRIGPDPDTFVAPPQSR